MAADDSDDENMMGPETLTPAVAGALFWEDSEDDEYDNIDYDGSNYDEEIRLLIRLTKWQAESKS